MALTELIIPTTDTPGAKQANVYRYIDLFLSVKSAAEQKEFMEELAFIDGYANANYGHDFVNCSEQEQTEILSRLAAADTSISDEDHAFFGQMRSLTTAIYCAMPEGYQDLKKANPAPEFYGSQGPWGSLE